MSPGLMALRSGNGAECENSAFGLEALDAGGTAILSSIGVPVRSDVYADGREDEIHPADEC